MASFGSGHRRHRHPAAAAVAAAAAGHREAEGACHSRRRTSTWHQAKAEWLAVVACAAAATRAGDDDGSYSPLQSIEIERENRPIIQ